RGAAGGQNVETTWKLRIRWKLRTRGACFISAGRKVSTLTAPGPDRRACCPAHGSQGHHASRKLAPLPSEGPEVSRIRLTARKHGAASGITARSAERLLGSLGRAAEAIRLPVR